MGNKEGEAVKEKRNSRKLGCVGRVWKETVATCSEQCVT